MFVLACTVAGVVGGGLSIFFWKATKFFIGAWGGLAFGLWIQCFHNGGLIHPIALRWIMYIGTLNPFGLATYTPLTAARTRYQAALLQASCYAQSLRFIITSYWCPQLSQALLLSC